MVTDLLLFTFTHFRSSFDGYRHFKLPPDCVLFFKIFVMKINLIFVIFICEYSSLNTNKKTYSQQYFETKVNLTKGISKLNSVNNLTKNLKFQTLDGRNNSSKFSYIDSMIQLISNKPVDFNSKKLPDYNSDTVTRPLITKIKKKLLNGITGLKSASDCSDYDNDDDNKKKSSDKKLFAVDFKNPNKKSKNFHSSDEDIISISDIVWTGNGPKLLNNIENKQNEELSSSNSVSGRKNCAYKFKKHRRGVTQNQFYSNRKVRRSFKVSAPSAELIKDCDNDVEFHQSFVYSDLQKPDINNEKKEKEKLIGYKRNVILAEPGNAKADAIYKINESCRTGDFSETRSSINSNCVKFVPCEDHSVVKRESSKLLLNKMGGLPCIKNKIIIKRKRKRHNSTSSSLQHNLIKPSNKDNDSDIINLELQTNLLPVNSSSNLSSSHYNKINDKSKLVNDIDCNEYDNKLFKVTGNGDDGNQICKFNNGPDVLKQNILEKYLEKEGLKLNKLKILNPLYLINVNGLPKENLTKAGFRKFNFKDSNIFDKYVEGNTGRIFNSGTELPSQTLRNYNNNKTLNIVVLDENKNLRNSFSVNVSGNSKILIISENADKSSYVKIKSIHKNPYNDSLSDLTDSFNVTFTVIPTNLPFLANKLKLNDVSYNVKWDVTTELPHDVSQVLIHGIDNNSFVTPMFERNYVDYNLYDFPNDSLRKMNITSNVSSVFLKTQDEDRFNYLSDQRNPFILVSDNVECPNFNELRPNSSNNTKDEDNLLNKFFSIQSVPETNKRDKLLLLNGTKNNTDSNSMNNGTGNSDYINTISKDSILCSTDLNRYETPIIFNHSGLLNLKKNNNFSNHARIPNSSTTGNFWFLNTLINQVEKEEEILKQLLTNDSTVNLGSTLNSNTSIVDNLSVLSSNYSRLGNKAKIKSAEKSSNIQSSRNGQFMKNIVTFDNETNGLNLKNVPKFQRLHKLGSNFKQMKIDSGSYSAKSAILPVYNQSFDTFRLPLPNVKYNLKPVILQIFEDLPDSGGNNLTRNKLGKVHLFKAFLPLYEVENVEEFSNKTFHSKVAVVDASKILKGKPQLNQNITINVSETCIPVTAVSTSLNSSSLNYSTTSPGFSSSSSFSVVYDYSNSTNNSPCYSIFTQPFVNNTNTSSNSSFTVPHVASTDVSLGVSSSSSNSSVVYDDSTSTNNTPCYSLFTQPFVNNTNASFTIPHAASTDVSFNMSENTAFVTDLNGTLGFRDVTTCYVPSISINTTASSFVSVVTAGDESNAFNFMESINSTTELYTPCENISRSGPMMNSSSFSESSLSTFYIPISAFNGSQSSMINISLSTESLLSTSTYPPILNGSIINLTTGAYDQFSSLPVRNTTDSCLTHFKSYNISMIQNETVLSTLPIEANFSLPATEPAFKSSSTKCNLSRKFSGIVVSTIPPVGFIDKVLKDDTESSSSPEIPLPTIMESTLPSATFKEIKIETYQQLHNGLVSKPIFDGGRKRTATVGGGTKLLLSDSRLLHKSKINRLKSNFLNTYTKVPAHGFTTKILTNAVDIVTSGNKDDILYNESIINVASNKNILNTSNKANSESSFVNSSFDESNTTKSLLISEFEETANETRLNTLAPIDNREDRRIMHFGGEIPDSQSKFSLVERVDAGNRVAFKNKSNLYKIVGNDYNSLLKNRSGVRKVRKIRKEAPFSCTKDNLDENKVDETFFENSLSNDEIASLIGGFDENLVDNEDHANYFSRTNSPLRRIGFENITDNSNLDVTGKGNKRLPKNLRRSYLYYDDVDPDRGDLAAEQVSQDQPFNINENVNFTGDADSEDENDLIYEEGVFKIAGRSMTNGKTTLFDFLVINNANKTTNSLLNRTLCISSTLKNSNSIVDLNSTTASPFKSTRISKSNQKFHKFSKNNNSSYNLKKVKDGKIKLVKLDDLLKQIEESNLKLHTTRLNIFNLTDISSMLDEEDKLKQNCETLDAKCVCSFKDAIKNPESIEKNISSAASFSSGSICQSFHPISKKFIITNEIKPRILKFNDKNDSDVKIVDEPQFLQLFTSKAVTEVPQILSMKKYKPDDGRYPRKSISRNMPHKQEVEDGLGEVQEQEQEMVAKKALK